MLAVRLPIASLGQCVLGIKRKCIKLFATACDSYRPERHYMRGPGPKWFAKHGVVPLGRYVEARQKGSLEANVGIYLQQALLSAPPGHGKSRSGSNSVAEN